MQVWGASRSWNKVSLNVGEMQARNSPRRGHVWALNPDCSERRGTWEMYYALARETGISAGGYAAYANLQELVHRCCKYLCSFNDFGMWSSRGNDTKPRERNLESGVVGKCELGEKSVWGTRRPWKTLGANADVTNIYVKCLGNYI